VNQSVNEQVLLESVGYVLRLMQISRKELIEEMKTEIAAVLHTIPQVDAAALAADARRMEAKKQTLLDRFLEGIVSESDYKRQNALYAEQITEIQRKIAAHQQLQTELHCQARKTEECIECVKKMLDFETPDEYICGEVTECITVHHGHILEVKLRYIPAVRLKYRTSGRGSRYTAEFERI
jgi:hypothetical protein